MKVHSSDFKENIKEIGRQFDSILSYTNGSEMIELGSNELNSVTAHYEGAILKSVMRCLDVDSNIEIPKGTIVNYQYGIVIGTEEDQQTGEISDVYEYIDFGDYIVNEVEKKEDTNSYMVKCYDKMLYSMVDYERLGEYSLTEDTTFQKDKNYYSYANNVYTLYTGDRTGNPVALGLYEYTFEPITIDDYIKAICDHLGLVFKNYGETYANSDKIINEEFYIATDGTSLNFTFRDVLDDLAEVTASTIVINEEDGELEIRYINETNDTIDAEYLKNVKVDFGQKYGPINSIVLSRSAESDNVYLKDDESIAENGLCELKIIDNEIMNLNDRDQYLPDILEKLDGLEFYLNDYSSTGICYYNVCDKYNVEITRIDDETEEETTVTYPCIMFNDEVLITQGLEENIHADIPDGAETDYKHADTTDKRINKAYLIVKKNESEIEGLVSSMGEFDETIDQVVQNVTGLTNNFIKNGGTNLFYNTGLHFKDDNDNFTYWQVEPENEYNITEDTTYQDGKEYYVLVNNNYVLLIAGTDYNVGDTISGNVYEITLTGYLNVVNDSESLSGTNMVLPLGKVSQTIQTRPDTYSYSFYYRQNVATSQDGYVKIGTTTINFEPNTEWQKVEGTIITGSTYYITADTTYLANKQYYSLVNNKYILLVVGTDYQVGSNISGTVYEKTQPTENITVEFNCDIQGGYYIKELMLIRGEESVDYSQNANESRTDTVKISNGIEVSSTSTNTVSRHDSDGFRILRKDNKEVVLRATENGTETTSIKASNDSEVAGLLIKKYNGHVLMSGKGDD